MAGARMRSRGRILREGNIIRSERGQRVYLSMEMLRLLLAPLLLLGACAGPTPETLLEDPTSGPAWTVILVRHAEKTADANDPGLTPAGEARAMTLQLMLRSTELDAVHSTDFRRTKDTVANLTAWNNLQLRFYDARSLDDLALAVGRVQLALRKRQRLGSDRRADASDGCRSVERQGAHHRRAAGVRCMLDEVGVSVTEHE